MKKFNLIVLIASSMLFVACGDKASDAAETAKNSVAEATTKAADATKEAASKAVDAAAEAAKAAKEKAAKMAAEAKAAAEKAAAEAKEKAAAAAKAAEEKAAKIAEEAKAKAAEVAKAAEEKTAAATEAVKEKVADAVSSGDAESPTASAPKVDTAAGAALYAKCAGCHGKDGKTKALGKSAVIAGQDAAVLAESIKGYKAGTRNVSGMGTLMKGQVASMSDSDIEAVSAYISTLK